MVPGIVYLSRPQDADTDQIAPVQTLAYGLDRINGFRLFRPGNNQTGGALATEQIHEWAAVVGFTQERVVQGDAATAGATAAGVSMSALANLTWGWFCCYGIAPCDGTYAINLALKTAAAGAVQAASGGAGDSQLIVGYTHIANTSIVARMV